MSLSASAPSTGAAPGRQAGVLARWSLLMVPVFVGVVLARRALRGRAGRAAAWAGLVVNALLALLVLYQFVDAIRMSYFAPLD